MRGPWEYEDPNCASVGGDFWFPEFDKDALALKGTDEKKIEVKAAKSICNSCTHKIECQQWGIKHERFGIWGGLTERDRRPVRNRLNIIVEEVGIVNFAESLGNSTYQGNTST
jgi:hypothetical protein